MLVLVELYRQASVVASGMAKKDNKQGIVARATDSFYVAGWDSYFCIIELPLSF